MFKARNVGAAAPMTPQPPAKAMLQEEGLDVGGVNANQANFVRLVSSWELIIKLHYFVVIVSFNERV